MRLEGDMYSEISLTVSAKKQVNAHGLRLCIINIKIVERGLHVFCKQRQLIVDTCHFFIYFCDLIWVHSHQYQDGSCYHRHKFCFG